MNANSLNTVFAIAASAVAVLAFVLTFILLPLLKRVKLLLNDWDHFMRDWRGEPAEPGRDATPGVMERLNRIDGEFKTNHGSTMKDAVDKLNATTSGINHTLNGENGIVARLERVEKNQPTPPPVRKAA